MVKPSPLQPPVCDASGENTLRRRRKRQTIEIDDSDGELYDPDREELRVKVYSGLYVNEATDLDDDLAGGDDYADEIVSADFWIGVGLRDVHVHLHFPRMCQVLLMKSLCETSGRCFSYLFFRQCKKEH